MQRPRQGVDLPRPRAERTREWFGLRHRRGTGLRWVVRPDGHRAVSQPGRGDGMPLYSLRAPESEEFFSAAWSALLSRAEEEGPRDRIPLPAPPA